VLRCMGRQKETDAERAARKASLKEAKAAKRAGVGVSGTPQGRKPCTLCQRPRDLLVR
jgi:hypothetical protein